MDRGKQMKSLLGRVIPLSLEKDDIGLGSGSLPINDAIKVMIQSRGPTGTSMQTCWVYRMNQARPN